MFGPCLGILGNLWGSLRSNIEASVGPVQACLGASLGASVRAVRGPLGASCGSLGGLLGPPVGLLGRKVWMFGLRPPLGTPWGRLRALLSRRGRL